MLSLAACQMNPGLTDAVANISSDDYKVGDGTLAPAEIRDQ
jgi:hypothetical protein